MVLYQDYLTVDQQNLMGVTGWETLEIYGVFRNQVMCFDLSVSREAYTVANIVSTYDEDISIVVMASFIGNISTIVYYECVER